MNTEDPRSAPPSANRFLVGLLVILTVLLAWQLWSDFRQRADTEYVPREITPRGDLAEAEKTVISVFRQASPSVVFIRTKGYQRYLLGEVKETELSSGTGFVWDDHGHVVTNLHVVRQQLENPQTQLEIQFSDDTVADARIIGGVFECDIAVLKVDIDSSRLRPIRLGTSHDLQIGQWVMAIGNPFGFDRTLSTGVIGGLNRSVATGEGNGILDGLIQTDAAINPGNSGGPLLDSAGRMIGVNTAIVSPTGAYSGLGFAVPVDRVMSAVNMVLEESAGNKKAILGITVLTREQARLLQIPEEIIERGLFIKQVQDGGPADRAGLRGLRQNQYGLIEPGDQVVSVDGQPVTSLQDLQKILSDRKPGDTVKVTILRYLPDGRVQQGDVEVQLEAAKLFFW